MLKRLMKSPVAAWMASILIGAYLRLLGLTTRKSIHNRASFDDAMNEGKGVILAFWHGRLALAPFLRTHTDARVHMLVSNHRDGEIIVNGVAGFGINFIRGSAANPKKPDASKHGASAVARILAALEAGDIVAMTPDGPRGPGHTVKAGILKIAELSGAPIIAGGLSASAGPPLKSWDRFLLPAPFSRLIYVAGTPIRVAEGTDNDERESQRLALENELARVTGEADRLAGRTVPLVKNAE